LREYGYRGALEIVCSGVDLEPSADGESLRRQGERLLGAAPGDLVLLYVGQHIWEKNLELLIGALKAVRSMGDKFRMIFVGEGYAATALAARVDALGLSGCTRFAGVVHDRAVLAACYARANCLLFPSLYETNGLVVHEAAAFGVPSLLVEGSAASEGAQDGVNAFIAGNSVKAYAARLHDLIGHRGVLAAVGAEARQSLYHSWADAIAEVRSRYLRLIRRTELCGEPKPA
jgi:1,2-diacylglycerol 3-alpha-glucosyltransferase